MIEELALVTEICPVSSQVEPLICVTETGPTNVAPISCVEAPDWPGTVPNTCTMPPPLKVNEDDVLEINEPVLNDNQPQDAPPQDNPETASEGPPAKPTCVTGTRMPFMTPVGEPL